MDTNDLSQIAALLEKHTSDIKNFVKEEMAVNNVQLREEMAANNAQLKKEMANNNMQIASMFEEAETRSAEHFTRIEVKIENEVAKRIDALFDGYKLTHEKQWEMQHEIDRIKQQLDEIRTRLGIAG